MYIVFLSNYYITKYNSIDIKKIVFTRNNVDKSINSDCFDVCFYNKGYCLEFYDKESGLEIPCGKGENKNFQDKYIDSSQFSNLGDLCICLIPNDHMKQNKELFICSPDKKCKYDKDCIKQKFKYPIKNNNIYLKNLNDCIIN
tara:strand:- start:1842 stop:2270 length:429 start_codon:yes stop_codon:yes gene_type:complete